MSPLVVFAAVIAAVAAAPQAIKPAAIQAYQPLAYNPTAYHTGYNHLGYNQLAYSQPAYNHLAHNQAGYNHLAYSQPGYNHLAYNHAGYNHLGNSHLGYSHLGYSAPAYKPYAAAAAPVAFKSAAAPIVPAAQPYHAYHQYAGQPQNRPVAIVKFTHDDNFDGSFVYDFEAENGISSQASGYVKALGPEEQGQVMQGQYSYVAPDGTPITTRWFADETGFHAEGAHLPENVAKTAPYKTA